MATCTHPCCWLLSSLLADLHLLLRMLSKRLLTRIHSKRAMQAVHALLDVSLRTSLSWCTALPRPALHATYDGRGVYPMAISQCAVGLSGVIFGLLVIDNHQAQASQRSIFGLFTVPAHAYPYALLILWQLLMPSASFMGHLCGLLVSMHTSAVFLIKWVKSTCNHMLLGASRQQFHA